MIRGEKEKHEFHKRATEREREMLDQKKEKLELKCRTARNGTVMNDHELLEHIKRNTT